MLVILLSIATLSAAQKWDDPARLPNPRRADGFKQCNMRSISSVCDPDEVISMDGRYRLNSEVQRISSRTEKTGNSFCDRKGTDAVLVLVRQGSQQLVNELSRLWHMDDQCKKSVVFLLSADDRRLYFAAQPNVDFNSDELQSIIDSNSMPLQTGDFVVALGNILKEVGKRTDIGVVTPAPHDPSKVAASMFLSALSLLIAVFIAF